MDDAMGIGLAATQVGMLARVLVYRVEPESPTARR
jgi:peptide deformylase